tara:strand:+ start:74 stop:331 length:258 start_codon:yes stop_codon:yes gene_type:complete
MSVYTDEQLVEYTEFSKNDRENLVEAAESIRNWAESIARYIDHEAGYEIGILQNYRQESGDIGDKVNEINIILNKWLYSNKGDKK